MESHPSENYIKYLLVRPVPEAEDNDWIRSRINALGYPMPDSYYLDSLRDEIQERIPEDLDLTDRYHRPTTNFLKDLGVWSLHIQKQDVLNAMELLTNRAMRFDAEKLLLGRVDPVETTRRLNSRYGSFLTVGTIRAFSHYFWNVGLLKTQDWAEFFQYYNSAEVDLALVILRSGASMALHTTGFQQAIDGQMALREALEVSLFDLRAWKTKAPSKDRTDAISKNVKSIAMANAQLNADEGAGMKEQLRNLAQQFRMKPASKQVKGIDDLAPAGNFTDSGADVKELPPAEKNEDKEWNEALKKPQEHREKSGVSS